MASNMSENKNGLKLVVEIPKDAKDIQESDYMRELRNIENETGTSIKIVVDIIGNPSQLEDARKRITDIKYSDKSFKEELQTGIKQIKDDIQSEVQTLKELQKSINDIKLDLQSKVQTLREELQTEIKGVKGYLHTKTRDLQDSLCEDFFELTVDGSLHQFTSSTEYYKCSKDPGEQVIHTACRFGRIGAIRKLIQNGTSVDSKTYNGWTPLIYAAEFGHLNTVKYMIHANALIDHQNNSGDTALIRSSWRGHKAVVEYLCSKKADVHIRTKNNCTALSVAGGKDREEIVNTLKKYGA